MEEFKKPSLPIASIKIDKSESNLKKLKDNSEKPAEKDSSIESENPAQQCPYKIPQWSICPKNGKNYSFEVLKSGQIIDEIKQLQKKAFWTFGRLPENDVEMAHPTISRFHAILQYRPNCSKAESINDEDCKNEESAENSVEDKVPPEGWYLYDLGSTHGTFLNKQRIPPKVYIRIRVGHMLRLGASTRSYILQGPPEDEEPESELTVTELKAKRQQELEEAALEKQRLAEEAIERSRNEGCSWGMAEDADEESDLTHNPYASTNNEELFLDDPKKTLRGYFEREGLELVYKCDEMSAGSFICRVELPLDDANGRPIVAEVVHKGKKKDCVVQCALEACRILDRYGVLRQANQEPLKRKQKSKESDSDDDEFWDRTGDVARKKQRKANASTSVTLTYDDLLKQENDINEQIKEIEIRINEYQDQQQRLKSHKSDDGEDLDAFMENLQNKEIKLDKTEIRKLRLEEQRLKSEKVRVQRLIRIAKPVDLPFSTQITEQKQSQGQHMVKKQLPMIGKRNQFSKFKVIKMEVPKYNSKPAKVFGSDEEEIEEDDEPVEKTCEENKQNLNNKSEYLPAIAEDNGITKKEKGEHETLTGKENETATTYSTNLKKSTEDEVCNTGDFHEKSCKTIKTLPELVENNIENAKGNKKRRQRIRQRGKRQEVDMDDDVEYESSDKYAKWVPPENQTGDGFTELNKKFGY
ncbi:kanadaptin [Cochliomyia hominivorax]